MAIGVDMQIMDKRVDYVNPFEVERGGILSLTTLSGVQYATYEPNPTSTTIPLGLMMHDQEEVDLFRAVAPWSTRRAYPANTPFPYLIMGEVITNAVHPHIDPSMVKPGAPAYLAPSGLITCVNTYNSTRIGTFTSTLNDSRLNVPGGASALKASRLRVAGNAAIVDPDPVYASTAGWVRIRIHIR
jgi:hypothetical protein